MTPAFECKFGCKKDAESQQKSDSIGGSEIAGAGRLPEQ